MSSAKHKRQCLTKKDGINNAEIEFLQGVHEVQVLTYHSIGVQRFVVEAENGGQIVKIGVLRNEVPLRVVHPVIEVCHRDLYPPVLLVVNLDMPMHSYWAHV